MHNQAARKPSRSSASLLAGPKEKPKTVRQHAIALRYDAQSDAAPVVSASGNEHVARLMRRLALRYGIPMAEDMGLAERLCELDIDEQIPPELFEEVAIALVRHRR